MKNISLGIFFCLFLLPQWCSGQSRYRSNQLKYVDEARHKAVAGTLLPLVVGIGSATIINNKTVQTTGSFLAVYGLILGPSAGNFYAEDYLRGMLGVAARVGGGYLIKDATREIFGSHVADATGWDKKRVSLGNTRVLIGAGLIIGSAVYNVISTKSSVKRYNRKQGYYIRPSSGYGNGRFVPMISAGVSF